MAELCWTGKLQLVGGAVGPAVVDEAGHHVGLGDLVEFVNLNANAATVRAAGDEQGVHAIRLAQAALESVASPGREVSRDWWENTRRPALAALHEAIIAPPIPCPTCAVGEAKYEVEDGTKLTADDLYATFKLRVATIGEQELENDRLEATCAAVRGELASALRTYKAAQDAVVAVLEGKPCPLAFDVPGSEWPIAQKVQQQLAAVRWETAEDIINQLRERAVYWDNEIPDKSKWDFRAEISAAFDFFAQELADRLAAVGSGSEEKVT